MINDGVQFVLRALNVLRPDADYSVGATYNSLRWLDKNTTKPTEEEFNAKVEEMRVAEPMRLLREDRNKRLQETDWTQYRDVSLSNDSDWQTYRQSLRDLPSTASPTLDEQGNLTNVTWPTKPE